MTPNASVSFKLNSSQIPPTPPLQKWGYFFGHRASGSPLCKRGARGDLKTLNVEMIFNLTLLSHNESHELC